MPKKIPSLDGLRAISIVLVIVSHAFGPVENHGFWFNLVLKHGGMGVRIFFIISGFLITTLCLEERREFGSLSLRLFYLRRGLRILPAFYLYTLSILILGLIGRLPIDGSNWLYVFTWTVNYNPAPSWFVAHLWSLSVEEQFYLAWPLALKFMQPRAWGVIAFTAVFLGLGWKALQTVTGVVWIDPLRLPYAFPFVCAPIALGALLAMNAGGIEKFIQSWTPARVAISGGIFLLFETFTEMHAGPWRLLAEWIVDVALTAGVAWSVFVPATTFGKILDSAPAVFIGKLSYSLYLWQELWVWRTDRPFYVLPVAVAAIFACALVSHYTLERPFLALRQKLRRSLRDIPSIAISGIRT